MPFAGSRGDFKVRINHFKCWVRSRSPKDLGVEVQLLSPVTELIFQLLHSLSHFILKVRLVFLHEFYGVVGMFEVFRYFLELKFEICA